MLYKAINGWTREKMKAQIRAGNKGTRARVPNFAYTSSYQCRYLTPDGNRCAVGCFIPDGHEGQECEHIVTGLLDQYPDLVALMPLGVHGMAEMQHEHDCLPSYEEHDVRDVLCAWVDANVIDGEEGQ